MTKLENLRYNEIKTAVLIGGVLDIVFTDGRLLKITSPSKDLEIEIFEKSEICCYCGTTRLSEERFCPECGARENP